MCFLPFEYYLKVRSVLHINWYSSVTTSVVFKMQMSQKMRVRRACHCWTHQTCIIRRPHEVIMHVGQACCRQPPWKQTASHSASMKIQIRPPCLRKWSEMYGWLSCADSLLHEFEFFLYLYSWFRLRHQFLGKESVGCVCAWRVTINSVQPKKKAVRNHKH